jgi:hypothetical protein
MKKSLIKYPASFARFTNSNFSAEEKKVSKAILLFSFRH